MDEDSPDAMVPLQPGTPSLTLIEPKTFRFQWEDVPDTDFYQLIETLGSDAAQVGSDIPQGVGILDHIVPLHARLEASYLLRRCNSAGCVDSPPVPVTGQLQEAIGYFKASNSEAEDTFGRALALSADGNTMAVGSRREDSASTDPLDNSATDAGAVYIFRRDTQNQWTQEAYLKASVPGANDLFGHSVALSADGSTLAVGARNDDADSADPDFDCGAVYVFIRNTTGPSWSEEKVLHASNKGQSDFFGAEVSLSGDGDTLVVGAPGEDGEGDGVATPDLLDQRNNAGAAYILTRSAGSWTEQAYLKAEASDEFDTLGKALAISKDGNVVAVGADHEDGNGDTIDDSGAVHLFTRNVDTWTHTDRVEASTLRIDASFGYSLALSETGATLAVGAIGESSNATGVDGDQNDSSTPVSGAAYVFVRSGNSWPQQAYIKASNTGMGDSFGFNMSLSLEGDMLAVSAYGERSGSRGVGGEQDNDDSTNSGAVYVFQRQGGLWEQSAYVKAKVGNALDRFGADLELSGDGSTMAIGAEQEDSGASGIGASPDGAAKIMSGAVFLY